MRAAFRWMKIHRRRLAPLVLGGAVLVVGAQWRAHAPSDVRFELPLGSGHARVTEVNVAFHAAHEIVRRVSLRFPDGAPERVRHTVELPPGRYEVAVDLVDADGIASSRLGRLDAPAEGIVRVFLEEGP